MDSPAVRQPHASLVSEGRWPKAEKIRRLLSLDDWSRERPPRVLEIGTGSGAIAHYLAVRSGLGCDVDAVDVVDQRQIRDGYRFTQVDSVVLPFDDAQFDIVISNHVLEHVGAQDQQRHHLREIARVLTPEGRAYLASPNRWQVVEPHFNVAFLSWLPQALRTPYLKMRGKGEFYDCEPLRMGELERLLAGEDLHFRNACVPALRVMLDLENQPSLPLRWVGKLPDRILEWMKPVCPTHVYLLRKKSPAERNGHAR